MKQQRRTVIKSLVLGSGGIAAFNQIPTSWSRPVVTSLILPAHAQTTNSVAQGPFFGGDSLAVLAANNTVTGAESIARNKVPGQSWLDLLISPASAGTVAMNYIASLNMSSVYALLIRIAYESAPEVHTPLAGNRLIEALIPAAQAKPSVIPGACLSGNLQTDVYTLLSYVDCEQVFGKVWGKLAEITPDKITGMLKFEDDSVRSFSVSSGNGSVPCECVSFLDG